MSRVRVGLLALAVILGGSVAIAQDEPPADTKKDRQKELLEGTHVLRRILYDHGFVALKEIAELEEKADETLLVVLGDLRPLAEVPDGLETFVRRGGAVLAASDRRADEAARVALASVGGCQVDGDKFITRDQQMMYKGMYKECPRVVPRPNAVPALFVDANLGTEVVVYTNRPSQLLVGGLPPGEVRRLASLPGGRPFAVGGNLGDGRVLVLADHSVFINQMMLPTDTNNVEFSGNAVRWLQGERPDGKPQRKWVLFIEEGTVRERLDIPLRSVQIPPEEVLNLLFARRNELLVEAEGVVARMEDDDFFNTKLVNGLYTAGITPDRLVAVGLPLLTLVVLLVVAYRLGIGTRFRHDTSVPLLTTALGTNLPADPLVEQRQEALLRGRNAAEPAAALVGRWFGRLGVETAAEPAFTAAGGWWARRRRVARLRQLWKLARGEGGGRVTPAGLWALQRELDELAAAHGRGEWTVRGG